MVLILLRWARLAALGFGCRCLEGRKSGKCVRICSDKSAKNWPDTCKGSEKKRGFYENADTLKVKTVPEYMVIVVTYQLLLSTDINRSTATDPQPLLQIKHF